MAKRKSTKARKSIPRQTRRFQLRKNNPVDTHVGEILDYARSQRKEVTTIRDGVRLIWALENNDLSVLFEMFPHLKSNFQEPVSGGEGEGSIEEKEALADLLLSRLVTGGYLMKSNPAPQPQSTGHKPDSERTGQDVGLKGQGQKQFAMPTFDDEDETLPVLVTKAGVSGSENFAMNLIGGVKALM